mgnify:CR=1 FL=1|jgi:hypothetical protein
MSKMGRHILAKQEEELNKHRQVKDSVYKHNLEGKDNKFKLCHLGELVSQLVSIYSNDTELGKEIRNAVNQLNSKNE